MKLYDTVKRLLIEDASLRDSDKKLLWETWRTLGFLSNGALYYNGLMKRGCPTFESVTRCRRKIQEKHPSLQASPSVQRERNRKRKTKGTFIYREKVNKKLYIFNPATQTYREVEENRDKQLS